MVGLITVFRRKYGRIRGVGSSVMHISSGGSRGVSTVSIETPFELV